MIQLFMALDAGSKARVLCIPLTLFFLYLCGVLINQISKANLPPHAIDSSNYRVPTHTHVVDFERSEVAPQADGSVLAKCCIQGCSCVVRIGHTVVELSRAGVDR